ncbi:MAG: collagen-like protein [Winogradskyella sp.]|nr:collagen-like protein [Winogradskyella sp.]NNK39524.1 collagen-like protein [Winogradskyella sp.]
MKRILSFISVFALLFTACEGDPGPPGIQGPQGPAGGLIVASAFEIVIDFTEENNYEFIEAYGFDVFPSDVTLVYILWDTLNGQDIWRLMPQTVPFEDGDLVYNFDFTIDDVRFFLDGTTDFSTLDPVWTEGQVFRVVVIPADNVDSIDVSDINNVMQLGNIQSFDIR